MKYAEFLEKFSSIDKDFIRDIFSKYDENTSPGAFVIDLDVATKYLHAYKRTLMATLRESYVENVDFKVIGKVAVAPPEAKRPGPAKTQVLMTVQCFKLLCMQSRAPKASEVRRYFLELEKTLMRYKDTINEALMQKITATESRQKRK